MKYESYFKNYLAAVELKLDSVLPPAKQHPSEIHQAMRYSVFPAGKRFRPVMVLAACEAAGGSIEDAILPAVSLELIHCFSLVHDDLPALDNDAERRGQPSCHKKFGGAIALLAGDALVNLAFHVLAKSQPAARTLQLLDEISTSTGTYGMIGGQAAELSAPKNLSLPMLDFISIHKTGMLIKSSAVCGAIAAGASKDARSRMLHYGEAMGLAFQLIDDCLDGDGYLKIIPEVEAYQKARDLIAHAKREIHHLGKKGEKLVTLADYLLKRLPNKKYATVDRKN